MARSVRVTWSTAQEGVGLPTFLRTIDPAWRDELCTTEGWSIVLEFSRTPREQGNPSIGSATFYLPGAPPEWLEPGSTLYVFERGTQQVARVDVLD